MGNKVVFCMLLVAAVVLLAVVVVGAFDRPDRDNDIVAYNVLAERMFEGTAAGKGHVIEGLMYFPLRTANTLVEVQIGPKEFVERNNFKLRSGDMVTVIGMPVVMKDRDVVLARQVSSMNGALTIRDPMGLPLWDKTDRPPHYTLLKAAEHVRYDQPLSFRLLPHLDYLCRRFGVRPIRLATLRAEGARRLVGWSEQVPKRYSALLG